MDIAAILTSRYEAEWALDGETYSGLTWLSDTPKPTKKELEALWPAVQADIFREAIEAARQAAYRTESDPIFFEYQRGDKTEQEWLDAVQAVKDAHPYPDTL